MQSACVLIALVHVSFASSKSSSLGNIISARAVPNAVVSLLTTSPVNQVSPAYISANLDWHTNSEEFPAWVNSSVLAINFTDPSLVTLATAFAPAHLRIGGSEQDEVWYEVDEPCPASVDPAFCLSMNKWDEINRFAITTGWTVLFGVNAMQGRANKSSRFNSTNLDAFLRFTASRRNYTALFGFAFGNELESKVDAAAYAADVLLVRSLIDK